MIIPFNNTYAVPALDLVPTYFDTLNQIQCEVKRYLNKDYGIKKLQSGGRGRQMLIAYDSLPVEIKTALGDPRAAAHLMENFYSTSKDAVAYYTNEYYQTTGLALKMELQEEYIVNASVLIAAKSLMQARKALWQSMNRRSMKGLLQSVLLDVLEFNKTLKIKYDVQHTLPSSLKRFKELYRNFAKEDGTFNYSALVSKRVGNKNSLKVKDNLLSLLNDLFATIGHKPTRTEVARNYEAFLAGYIEVIDSTTGELYNPKEFRTLSYGTITNYLAQWKQGIAAHHMRSGNRQTYMGQYKPAHKLEKTIYASSLISIDDRQPPFYYDKQNRMWFYMGIDLASEAWICWVWGESKEALILNFYRQLVRNYHEWGLNMPLGLECESSLNSSYRNTILREGVLFDDVRIEANNARGKRIERYFGSLRYGNEKQRNGWVGRPHARNEANQIGPLGKQIIPQAEIVEGCLKDIQDWNNTPHSSNSEISRFEYFLQNQNPNTHATNYTALLPHLGYSTTTSCSDAGIVRLQNNTFLLAEGGTIATGDTLIKLMERVAGKTIQVYWLDDNDGNVFVAHAYINNYMMCELIAQPTYSRAKAELTPQGIKAREVMSSYVSTIEAYRKAAVANITPLIITPTGNGPALKDTFKIRGLENYTPSQVEAQPLPQYDDTDTDAEFDNISTTTTTPSLLDRF
jgi:hypothetical protein